MRRIFLACIVAAGLSVPTLANEQNRTDRLAGIEGINPSNRIICRRFPPPVGTRIGARNICQTQAQWERYDQEVRAVLDEAFNRSKGF